MEEGASCPPGQQQVSRAHLSDKSWSSYKQPLRNEVCWGAGGLPQESSVLQAGSTLSCFPFPVASFCPHLCVEAFNTLEFLERSPWVFQLGPGCLVKVAACQLYCRPLCGPWPLGFREASRGSLTGSDHCWSPLLNGTQVLLFTDNWMRKKL